MKSPIPDDAKPLSKRAEQRLLAAGRSVFSTAFPNPERRGCPEPEVIRAVASRKADPAQHRDFIVHMSRCSPCFNDFGKFQEDGKRSRRRRDLTIAAVSVLVVGLALLAWSERRRLVRPGEAEVATLDLTHRGVLRGEESGPPKPPLELPSSLLDLTIYLPVGNEPAHYEMQVLKQAGTPLWTGEGEGNLENGIVALHFKVDLSEARPGSYFLAVRRARGDWAYYPLVVK